MNTYLVMQAGDGCERAFPLRQPRTIIGREPACNIRIPIPTVAQKHCEIALNHDQPHEWQLRDLGSDHGTYHNGKRVEQARLSHEDQLTIGPVTFIVRIQSPKAGTSAATNGTEAVHKADASAHIIIERVS